METFVTLALSILAMIALGTQLLASRTKTQVSAATNPEFKTLQRHFFIPYLLALFSDWLQGPYVYRLYSQYGYAPFDIALLYVIGFGSSVVFGTCTGPLADRFGRKRLCLVFSVMYSLCCLTKLSPNFYWLALGRVLGGISTSILFSTFEAWYVYQHNEAHSFPSDWISSTFSIATFWNGILAIAAGVIADITALWFNWGAVGPFLAAVPGLLVSGGFVFMSWPENYGSRSTRLVDSCTEGLGVIFSTTLILMLGLVQSMFESVMYIFVFLWTPILDVGGGQGNWPLGLVFSCFMVCIMIGSSLHAVLLAKGFRPPKILFLAVVCCLFSMLGCTLASNPGKPLPYLAFGAFLLLEVAVGLYFPSIGYLRSQVIPEALRASIMNWFRLPMNVIICGVLLWLHRDKGDEKESASGNQAVFALCSLMALVGVVTSVMFGKRFSEDSEESEKLENGRN